VFRDAECKRRLAVTVPWLCRAQIVRSWLRNETRKFLGGLINDAFQLFGAPRGLKRRKIDTGEDRRDLKACPSAGVAPRSPI
jgi:hypothetical protein